ncbi:hypothetical protein ACFO0N_07710 [Halobium salinum]|uniref:Uncharacterized protein n=1 Tax=Halobium salinum TaxID=1364940 RepID=A0ABD5PA92_9EURY|nr:hypothetical protein [Halobium salinum]
MSADSDEARFEVYLHPAEGGPELDSPLTTDYIHYYESGVWLDHADGQAFFPYGEVRTIVDHEEEMGEYAGRDEGVEGEAEAEDEVAEEDDEE